jgi:hypothetical protein
VDRRDRDFRSRPPVVYSEEGSEQALRPGEPLLVDRDLERGGDERLQDDAGDANAGAPCCLARRAAVSAGAKCQCSGSRSSAQVASSGQRRLPLRPDRLQQLSKPPPHLPATPARGGGVGAADGETSVPAQRQVSAAGSYDPPFAAAHPVPASSRLSFCGRVVEARVGDASLEWDVARLLCCRSPEASPG